MGTTLTAAMVWSEGVSIGHVGDSRAYRLRDGTLEQLTHDHSLVAELVAQRAADRGGGREPPAALDHHPRAGARVRRRGGRAHAHRPRRRRVPAVLGRPDGDDLRRRHREHPARRRPAWTTAAAALIKAANQSGGKDNITVVLFRLGEDDGSRPAADDTLAGSETIHQGLTADDVQAAVREQERAAAKAPDTGAGAPAPRGPAHARAPLARAPRPDRGRRPAGGGRRGLRRLRGRAPRLLPGHRRRRPGHDLPRRALRAAAGPEPVQRAVRLQRARAVAGQGPARAAAGPRVAQPGRRRGPGAPARARHPRHRRRNP